MLVLRIGMLAKIELETQSDVPLYRQLHEHIKSAIVTGRMVRGERLPATRELAGSLGLNHTTVAAAYELLESEGLIRGHVGRGSFVEGAAAAEQARVDWESFYPSEETVPAPAPSAALISFSASQPSEVLLPDAEFRATCREVADLAEAVQIRRLCPASG